uniref:FIIND domain-containing protein n=1 Tax=Salvator merianae TaxID=96440 RepID=A0A8D0DMK1_SALMN
MRFCVLSLRLFSCICPSFQVSSGASPSSSGNLQFCPTGAGSFHCFYTDLIFEVRGAVTITYQFASWKKHQSAMDAQNLMIAGPLLDIQADLIEAVAAVHFPHFLCLAAEDPSQVWIAHFVEEGMNLEKPDSVGPLHAVLENPRFSLRGAIFKKTWFKRKIKVHAMALLYQELEIVTPKFHLYLLPNDSSLKKVIRSR